MPDSQVVNVVRAHRLAMNAEEAATMRDMAMRWMEVERALDGNIAALANEMLRKTSSGETITPSMVRKAERYQLLKAQAEKEIVKYNRDAAKIISEGQVTALNEGLETAQDAIISSTEFNQMFNHINIGAVDSMVGYAGDGTPLRQLLNDSVGEGATDNIMNALINGVAQGLGADEVARNMAGDLGKNFDRSLVIARTEINRSYRTATIEQYKQSGVVIKYVRLVARDEACPSCLSLDGETFDTAEDAMNMEEHPNGRCTFVCQVVGGDAPEWEVATDWFANQSESKQRETLGAQRYELYKNGMPLSDMVHKIHNDTWGDSPALIPLKDLNK